MHGQTTEEPDASSYEALYLLGDIANVGWSSPDNALQSEKNGGVYTFHNVLFLKENETTANFQILTARDWVAARYLPGTPEEQDIILSAENNFSGVTKYVNPTDGDKSYGIANGIYNIIVNLNDHTVSATPVSVPAPERLYLTSDGFANQWWNSEALEGVKEGNVFTFTNVVLNKKEDGKDFSEITAALQFKLNDSESWDWLFCPNGDNTELLTANELTLGGEWLYDGLNRPTFKVPNGCYDFVVDLDNNTVKATPHDYDNTTVDFEMSFWEGEVFHALEDAGKATGNVKFSYLQEGAVNSRKIYEIKVADNIGAISYASQCWLGGKFMYEKITYDADKKTFTRNVFEKDWGDAKYYFDAHSTDVLVPVTTEFWGDNSRMEVGMTVKSIYLVYDPTLGYGEDGSTPFYITLSSTGRPVLGAAMQRPFNSDIYSLRLTDGTLHDALRGTRSGAIEIPFARHHTADGGYSISLGKYITTAEAESFEFAVNGITYTAGGFNLSTVDNLTDAGSGKNSIAPGLRFNKIILMVSDNPEDSYNEGKYNKYQLFLANEESKRPDGYEKYQPRNPLLKVWNNNDAEWKSLYDLESYTTADGSETKQPVKDGSVKYFEFEPTYGGQGHKTNLYYLDLGENGVEISRAGLDGKFCQFNIVANDGYDISTPYQGSQYIYPGTWWCANPNLLDPTGPREYKGKHFKAVPETASRVDLSWNLPEGTDKIKIYGITLFKVMGSGYDVYADAVRERPLYYIYAHTTRPEGASADAKCEKTSPILLEVTNPQFATDETDFENRYKESSSPLIYSENALNKYEAPQGTNNAFTENDGTIRYMLTATNTLLTTNDDRNYLLTDGQLLFTPGSTDAISYVDVNGSQRWSAAGSGDRLRPNTWSNYYSGLRNDGNIEVLRPHVAYFKMVLASNPDQVRYQLMSYDMSMTPDNSLVYSNQNEDSHNPDENLIYPVTDLEGIFIWRPDNKIRVTLTFTDAEGKTVGTREVWIDSTPDESQKLPDQGEGFFEEGEFSFRADLGEYFTNPEWSVKATAEYFGKDADSANPGSPTYPATESLSYSTGSFDTPTVKDLEALNPRLGDRDKGEYYSNLSWVNEESETNPGLPREYEIHMYDTTGTDSNSVPENTEGVSRNHDNGKAAATNGNDVEYSHGDERIQDATKVDNNGNDVTIGYRVGALYHYALPAEPTEYLAETANFANAPENFTAVTKASHENVNDRPFAEARFNNETTTGIDAVEAGNDAEVEIFTLSGVKVSGAPAPGIYIVRRGSEVNKTMIR